MNSPVIDSDHNPHIKEFYSTLEFVELHVYEFCEMFIKSDAGSIFNLNTKKQITEKVTVWVKLILYYTSMNLASQKMEAK